MILTIAKIRELEPEWSANFDDAQLEQILGGLRTLAGVVSNVYRKQQRRNHHHGHQEETQPT